MNIEKLNRLIANRRENFDLLFYVHIPKTAGTSLCTDMRKRFNPSMNLWMNYADDEMSWHQQRLSVVKTLISRMPEERFRFAHGHIPFSVAVRLMHTGYKIGFATFIREPLSRLVSSYVYQKSAAHPHHQRVRRDHPTFESFYRMQNLQNQTHKFLRLDTRQTVPETIDMLERQFCFIGLQEDYELCFRTLSAIAGEQFKPQLFMNKMKSPDLVPELSPDTIEEIKALNAADFEIYEHFASLWMENRDTVEQTLLNHRHGLFSRFTDLFLNSR